MLVRRAPAFFIGVLMKLMYKCAICGDEYGGIGITNHIQRTHKMPYKEYYDTYVDSSPHVCKYCTNEAIFKNLYGYRPTCHNPTCVRKLQHETMYAKYGKACRRPEKIKPKNPPIIEYKLHCEICGKGYQRINRLNMHINKCHSDVGTEAYHVKYLGVKVKYCEICGQKALWKGNHYHNICGSPDCLHELRSRHNAMNDPVWRQKSSERQRNMTAEQKKAKAEHYRKTCLERYGVDHNWKVPEIRTKCIETTREIYGHANGFQMPNAKKTLIKTYGVDHFSKSVEFAHRRKKKYMQDGIGFDSTDEILVYNFANLTGHTVDHHPDIRFEYTARNTTHYYEPDFRIDGRLYEVKGKQFFRDKDPMKDMINPYDRTMDDIYEAKHQCMIARDVKILTDSTILDLIKVFENIDITEDMLVNLCMSSPFPGTDKWDADHPIWKCYVPGHISPKDAWVNKTIVTKSVRNMIKVLTDSVRDNKYHSFCRRHFTALVNIKTDATSICRLVLNRFTVAKYAPKVTALRASDLLKIIDESGVDLSRGVYCPMAGFGGIVDGVKTWFKVRHQDPIIEAYDINQMFCDWYGWNQRDVLAQIVHTDKVVVVCPPFGKEYEHWDGTPDDMSDIPFKEWVSLIKQHVIAPEYVFIGPEVSPNKNQNKCGLFAKKVGIALYKEE